jgi:photosystem II stability/assembly factor-like uncharacterized protein
VAFGSGRYLAVGGSGQVASSADGRRWSALARPTKQDLYSIAHGTGGFVAVGALGTVLQSRDGKRWLPRRIGDRLNLHAVTWTGREWFIGGDRGRLFSSRDGARWHRVRFQGFHSIRDFATGNGVTVAAGAGTVALRGRGGIWTLEQIGFGRFQTSVAFGGGRFVVVGHNGEALASTDGGQTWTTGTTNFDLNLDRVVYADGRFIATGEGGAVVSTNGLTWKPLALPTSRSIRSVSVRRRLLVGVGDGGAIVRSTDAGVRWKFIPTRLGS